MKCVVKSKKEISVNQQRNLQMIDDVTLANEVRFARAQDVYFGDEHKRYNIGTLCEGTLHMVLKYFVCPDMAYHEVPVGGYIADVLEGDVITEIQTRDFRHLKDKLTAFLPEYKVHVVYPVAYIKRICKIDKNSGEISKPRKSPKKGRVSDILPELFYIKEHLLHPNLRIFICFLEITEYRCDNPKRRGRTVRYDRVPTSYVSHMSVRHGEYSKLLPSELSEEFTAKDFARHSGLCGMNLSSAIKTLCECGAITRIGKKGRAYVYKIND